MTSSQRLLKNTFDEAPTEDISKIEDHDDIDSFDPNEGEPKQLGRQHRKKIVKGIISNTLVAIGFLFANYLYKETDTICPYDDETNCAENFIFPNLFRWAIQLSIAAFIFMIVIYAGIYNKIYRIYAVVAISNIIYLVFFYHPVVNKKEYGQAFATLLVLLCIFVAGLLVFLSLFLYCFRKCRPLAIGTIVSIVMFCVLFYFLKVVGSCDQWTIGLGGDRIREDAPLCQVSQLKDTCIYEITSGWFDFSSWKKCKNEYGNDEVFQKYYPNTPVIGFPRAEKLPEIERLPLVQPIQKGILSRMTGLKSLDDPAGKDLEIFLDRSNLDNPHFVINVKKNQTLIDERSKIKSEGLAKNVIVLFIDALSRANAMRRIKKTMKWFEKHMNGQNPDMEAYQFFRYHSIAPVTYPNLFEAFYGRHPDPETLVSSNTSNATSSSKSSSNSSADPTVDTRIPSFVQTYKDMGYITGHSTDFCYPTPFDTPTNGSVKDTPYDHDSTSFACDPHFHIPDSPYNLGHGPYSAFRRCLYGKDTFEYAFEYGNQFWRKYKDQKKLLYFDLLDAHDGVGEMVKYADGAIEEFLENLRKESLLEDTAIILYADHGLHLAGIYYFLGGQQVVAEAYLPALFAVFPKKITEKYGVNIKANQQKLLSAREIYHLFQALAEGKESKSVNLGLLGPLPSKRTCTDIEVLDGRCVCNSI